MTQADQNRLRIPISETDHIRGPSEAVVTVVKYGDYESPDCQRTHHLLVKSAHGLVDRARYVYRHFPLASHPYALRAAEAAEAAGAQGRFWEMHDLLFTHPNRLGNQDLERYARKVGLDMNRFLAEMEAQLHASRIIKERDLALVNGVTGTPTFYINDVLFAGNGERVIEKVNSLLAGGV